jgi:cell division protein ZapA
MAGLLLADELQEARTNGGSSAPSSAASAATTDGVAEALNAVAARLEKLVQTI